MPFTTYFVCSFRKLGHLIQTYDILDGNRHDIRIMAHMHKQVDAQENISFQFKIGLNLQKVLKPEPPMCVMNHKNRQLWMCSCQ